ncbi:putative metal-nicotianamine transporter YSL7 [Vitis vinifera]|uniref:Putative metal-nicotianamine transporter YSL7 n=1 Tax=Vitis vinifera TaxID=29760 RepID=A0A438BTP2_VITVI|nr:putative metal-nicotianamine transporter YSL7 [Vitis vinifera]
MYIVAPVMAFCNAYGRGLTDWSLASTYGKFAIFTIGAWAGAAHGGVVAGLAACGVMMNIVSTTSDLMQDFKTGHLIVASPRSMFVSQLIGTAMGCVIASCVFWLFYKAFDDLGQEGSECPAPYALVYPILVNLIRDAVGKRRARTNKAKADAFGPAVASGLICGDGIWIFPSSILDLAGVKPKILLVWTQEEVEIKAWSGFQVFYQRRKVVAKS